jgi:prephenate dehydrogenase
MFGPDSASHGLQGLQVAICPLTISDSNLHRILRFWQKHGVTIVTTTPEAHDRDAAYSQAFTYSMAKIILGMQMDDVKLKTMSFMALSEVARLSANDSDQLFHDMLYYNPYFKAMKAELLASMATTEARLVAIEQEQTTTKIFSS